VWGEKEGNIRGRGNREGGRKRDGGRGFRDTCANMQISIVYL